MNDDDLDEQERAADSDIKRIESQLAYERERLVFESVSAYKYPWPICRELRIEVLGGMLKDALDRRSDARLTRSLRVAKVENDRMTEHILGAE